LRYRDTARAEVRAEELAAVINDRPGKLLKVGIALRFVSAALAARLRRLIGGAGADDPAEGFDTVLYEEASRFVARYLFPSEHFRGEWKRHWIHLLKSLCVGAIMGGLAVAAAWRQIDHRYAGWVIAGVVVTFLGWALLRSANWYFQRFVITNKRIMTAQGLLSRRVHQMPLLRVTDMRYLQSPLGRVLGYGTFQLEGAGRWNPLRVIKDLPNPNELYLRLVEEMYEPEAVQARISRPGAAEIDEEAGSESLPPFDAIDFEPAAPDDRDAPVAVAPDQLQLQFAAQIAALANQLTVLTAAVERLGVPGPLPSRRPRLPSAQRRRMASPADRPAGPLQAQPDAADRT
jgi:membrane protein YdbS with pleckstrin-like domain